MRALMLVLTLAATAAKALPPPCNTLRPENTALVYFGTQSGCNPASPGFCFPGEIIEFRVAAIGPTPECVPYRFVWRFGDVVYSQERSPTHVYVAMGRYDVAVTISSPYAAFDLATRLLVASYGLPVNPIVIQPLIVDNRRVTRGYRFYITAADSGGDWLWDFGDGATARGPVRQQDHVYPHGGRFIVRLTSTKGSGVYATTVEVPQDRRRSAGH